MPKQQARRKPATRTAWKREASDQNVTEKIGQRIREHREKIGLSLSSASELSGIPGATLSRIETNKMSPTFPVLLKLMTGLRLSWTDLIGHEGTDPDDEITVALPDLGEATSVPGYTYYVPHQSNPLREHIQPLIFDVSATNLVAAGGLRAHKGYEFTYVLSGSVIFHVEDRAPALLEAGASVLFRSNVPHAYVSNGPEPARLLNVISLDPVILRDALPYSLRYADDDAESAEAATGLR